MLRDELRAALSAVKASGSFACSGSVDDPPNPGLCIGDLGTIGFPLSIRDATAIKEQCHQSPFGKGAETLVDTTVRKCWELNPKDFELSNPKWHAKLEEFKNQAVSALALSHLAGDVRAELYKLLLYEEGAFFLPHKDSEKAVNMFGTMIISLPSQHTGGDLHLAHDDQQQVFSTSTNSQFGTTWAAWYADVSHEVKPITSGHRLVLTYNLIHTGDGQNFSLTALGDQTLRMRAVLGKWPKAAGSSTAPALLAYKLDHQYTEACLKLNCLKGKDLARVRALKEACEEEGIILYLGNMVRTVWGGCEGDEDDYYGGWGGGCRYGGYRESDPGDFHELIEICEESLELTLYDLDGNETMENVPLPDNGIVQEGIFDREPDEEDYSGPTGNEGVSATHWYRDAVIVMVPRSRYVDLVFKSAKDGHGSSKIESHLQTMQAEYNKTPTPQGAADLVRLCTLVVQEESEGGLNIYGLRNTSFTDQDLSQVAIVAARFKKLKIMNKAVSYIDRDVQPSMLTMLGNLYGRGHDILETLNLAFIKLKSVAGLWKATTAALDGFKKVQTAPPNLRESLLEWQSSKVDHICAISEMNSREDGLNLAYIAGSENGVSILQQKIQPFLLKGSIRMCVLIPFFNKVSQACYTGNMDAERCKITLDVLKRIILIGVRGRFRLERVSKKVRGYGYPVSFGSSYGGMEEIISLDDLTEFCDNLRKLFPETYPETKRPEEAINAFELLSEAIPTAAIETFQNLFLPSVKHLVSKIEANTTPGKDQPALCQFVQTVLLEYIKRYVDHEPIAPINYVRNAGFRSCSPHCKDCSSFMSFLTDANRKTMDFSMAQGRRNHLVQRMDKTLFTCETIREGSPHTLRVTKTIQEFTHNYAAWTQRFNTAINMLREIQALGPLSGMLGEHGPAIMSCKPSKTVLGGTDGNGGSMAGSSFAGQKRPAADEAAASSKPKKFPRVIGLT